MWSNRFFLSIGDVAGSNRLEISNSAKVWSGGSVLGNLSPARSNQVLVTGPGSLWTNQLSLSLGGSSVGNRTDVADGGSLASVEGYVGHLEHHMTFLRKKRDLLGKPPVDAL